MTVFFVGPQTGFQIKANIDSIEEKLRELYPSGKDFWGDLWECAARNQNEITEALRDNVAVIPDEEALWLCVPGREGMYYRIRKNSEERYALDMAINTNLFENEIEFANCVVPLNGEKNLNNVQNTTEIAHFTIRPYETITKIPGDLIIDFGNTGTVSAFVSSGDLSLEPIAIFNPWDPKESENGRSEIDKLIFHSNQLLFRLDSACEPTMYYQTDEDVDNDFPHKLWWLSGERANEIAKNISRDTTYIFSPKKFIRKWGKDTRAPRITLSGILGDNQVYDDGYKSDPIIKGIIRSQIGLIISSFVKTHSTDNNPVMPEFKRILLTYPLTWRKKDKDFFKDMVKEIFKESYNLLMSKDFKVEMSYYNEPYCVVAYLVSEIINKFGGQAGNWEMIRSIMGNYDKDNNNARLLIVDIGGGSSDIALVDVGLSENSGDRLECMLDLKATMRFNRAGDRISHMISTIIWEHIRKSRGLSFPLCDGKVVDSYRLIMRKLQLDIMLLSENVKKTLAMGKDWRWVFPDEVEILSGSKPADDSAFYDIIAQKAAIINNIRVLLDSVTLPSMNDGKRSDEQFLQQFMISNDIIQQCIERDYISGDPNKSGLYEVFVSLKRLILSLKNDSDSMPDRIILSGRTSRLPCIKSILNKVFRDAVPSFRIMSLEDFLPSDLRQDNIEFIEKMAVMLGVHAFRTGQLIEKNMELDQFHRFIGPIINDNQLGYCLSKRKGARWKLCSNYIRPGDSLDSCLEILVRPGTDVMLGQSFSENGFAEPIGSFSVSEMSETEREEYCEEGHQYYRVKICFDDDYSARLGDGDERDPFVHYTDIIPGGIEPVDNFCYDGKLDGSGQLSRIAHAIYPYL